MSVKISSVFLVVVATFLFHSKETGAVTSAEVKARITKANANLYIGIGGKYGKLSDTVSKKDIIESDHFPPKSVYASAKDPTIKVIAERDMAACSISYDDHRKLLTTGNGKEKAGYFNQWLKDLFAKGNYYEAVSMNIQVYKEYKILDKIKKGVMDGLLVHKANKLISDAQMKDLIKKYSLDGYDKTFEKNKERAEAVALVWK